VTKGAARRARWFVVVFTTVLLLAVPVVVTDVDRAAAPTGERADGPAGPEAAPGAGPEALPTGPESSSAPAPPPQRTGLAREAVTAAETAAGGSTDLAVAVLDRSTGELAVGERGAEPFYTASLSKVVVAVDILDRRRLDGLTVTGSDVDLLRRALGPSDDGAMNELWGRFDGLGAASRVSRRLGLEGTTAPRNPGQWGEMSVPATDTVRIWQHILEDMPPADRDLLISAMDAAPARARDGFNQAFGLLAPAVDGDEGLGAVAKQGWMCCFSGEYYLHSAGAVGPGQRFLVVLLTRVPRGPGWERARAEVTAIATEAVQALR
jgi:hypothetical protein